MSISTFSPEPASTAHCERGVTLRDLEEFVGCLLVAAGFGPTDAATASRCIIDADLRGIPSHGVARLPHYLRRIEGGSIHPRPRMQLERLAPAAARLDADHALGHLAMTRAADAAIDLAREAGAGWVTLRNSSHCGALPSYGLRLADAGMIGVVLTHVDALVIPFGAIHPFCGTNPLCITAPGPSGRTLCLDMATSVASWNGVAKAAADGVPIPSGWAVDENGDDTTDPARVSALSPMSGHKGSGLGLMIDILCAMLSNSPYGPDIPKMYGDMGQHRRLGGLVGAINIQAFLDLARFHERVGGLMDRWNALAPKTPGQRVLWPGERELITAEHRRIHGIPLPQDLIEQLSACAAAAGIPPLQFDAPLTHPSRDET